jgi:hypothetical protein
VVDTLRGQNGFDEFNSPGHINQLPIPSRKPPGAFVFKVLEIPSPEAPNRKWKTKVPQKEGSPSLWHALEDILKIKVVTSNRDHRAFTKIGAKAGDLAKVLKDSRKVGNVTLYGIHKHGRIIRIERGTQDDAPSSKLVKETQARGLLKNLGDGVNSKDE